jgi:hypothetical protein
MQQSIIDWGSVRLWNVQLQLSQDQVYDQTDTNPSYTRFTIVASGLVREWEHSYDTPKGVYSGKVTYGVDISDPPTANDTLPSTLTENMEDWRDRVGHRQRLAVRIGCDSTGDNGQFLLWAQPYQDGTTELWTAEGSASTKCWYDCNAGPKCRSFHVERIYAGHAARVVATFEVCIPWCQDYGGTLRKILEHTWSVADSIDNNSYTTRRYSGRVKVANPYVDPNLLRSIVVPPLAAGMRRSSMDFQVEADGRTLAYTILDKEVAYSAPLPASSMSIQATESISLGRPVLHTALSVRLEGDRNVSKKALAALAVAIAEERIVGLSVANNAADKTVLVEDLSLTEFTSQDNPVSIELRLSVQHLRNDGAAFNGANGAFGKDILGAAFPVAGYDANVSDDPGTEGPISLLGAMRSQLMSVCVGLPAIKDGSYSSGDDIEGAISDPASPPTVTARTVPTGSTTKPSWVSVQFATAIYTQYQVDSIYDTSYQRSQLPIAGLASSYTAGDATCSVVGLGYPMTTRTIRIEATRHGDPPLLQEPKDTWTTGSGSTAMTFTRLRTKVAPTTPVKSAVGQNVWTVRAEYVYACSRNPLNSEALAVGLDPTWTGSVPTLPSGTLDTFDETSTMS